MIPLHEYRDVFRSERSVFLFHYCVSKSHILYAKHYIFAPRIKTKNAYLTIYDNTAVCLQGLAPKEFDTVGESATTNMDNLAQ